MILLCCYFRQNRCFGSNRYASQSEIMGNKEVQEEKKNKINANRLQQQCACVHKRERKTQSKKLGAHYTQHRIDRIVYTVEGKSSNNPFSLCINFDNSHSSALLCSKASVINVTMSIKIYFFFVRSFPVLIHSIFFVLFCTFFECRRNRTFAIHNNIIVTGL